ncbi:hypothetical protein D3C83_217290 [compost metagenome]
MNAVSRERRRELVVETINGDTAATSPYAAALTAAGFRSDGKRLRLYASFTPPNPDGR